MTRLRPAVGVTTPIQTKVGRPMEGECIGVKNAEMNGHMVFRAEGRYSLRKDKAISLPVNNH